VVLGGGGVTGYAWEIGLLAGLKELGIDLSSADLFVGTSAGSSVSTQITTGATIEALYNGIGITSSNSTVFSGLAPGAVISEADWMGVMSNFFGPIQWPQRALKIAVVGAIDGKVRFFSSADGTPLVAAAAASSAMPGTVAPITVGGEQYVAKGITSGSRACNAIPSV
jgi:NTE family protein